MFPRTLATYDSLGDFTLNYLTYLPKLVTSTGPSLMSTLCINHNAEPLTGITMDPKHKTRPISCDLILPWLRLAGPGSPLPRSRSTQHLCHGFSLTEEVPHWCLPINRKS